ncbi:tetratricopeptide repeat protein [Paraglaciecola hydrolytica]|uniref:Uncharacterized protein n=1 Tax=Paraglaciecola hydrolytica TaxID=1799789 RepID=A0A136A0F1_9ALTE|nr:hypothetical protein [Paraglaciecola hydrolytica]KXI28677.1 hypothetical protein AX660_16520 [Paraglaciecola hydrolytica]
MSAANKKYYLSALIVCILSACATVTHEQADIYLQRQLLAMQLEAEEQYADALIQWKIAKTISPQQALVDAEVRRLSQLISQKTALLTAQAKKLTPAANSNSLKTICLKILALEPDNQFAMQQLRNIEFKTGLSAAEKKTAKMNENIKLSQTQQQLQKAQADYNQQSQNLLKQKNFSALLQLSQDYLLTTPKNTEAQQHQLHALLKLAEVHQLRGENEQAIGYLEQAYKLQPTSGVSDQLSQLKQQVSNHYFVQANKVLKSDIDKAVEYLQSSVAFDHNNQSATKLLFQAKRIQQNLRQIKATN